MQKAREANDVFGSSAGEEPCTGLSFDLHEGFGEFSPNQHPSHSNSISLAIYA